MILKIEPKEWLMHSVLLYFDNQSPAAEDKAIKDYLTDHGMTPKRTGETIWDGRVWSVMNFGGCYLGRHLAIITQIQNDVAK